MGLYRADSELFNLLQVPSELGKETVVNNILMECAELEVLYPNPAFMKYAIGEWSKMYKEVWERLLASVDYVSKPWDEVQESITKSGTRENTSTENGTEKTKNNETTTRTSNTTGSDKTSGTDTVTHKVAGFNSENFVNSSEDSTKYGGTVARTGEATENNTVNGTGDVTTTGQGSSNDSYDETVTRKTEHRKDVIDVVERVREAARFSVMQEIVNQFKERFCLLVY